MKRIFSSLYTVLISVLVASLVFAGGIPVTMPNMPPMAPQEEHGVVFRYNPSRNPTLDFASRTKLTQTYTPTNRTRINSSGLLESVAANTPVIDHIGTSLTPALRAEPAGTNLLFNSNTFTAAAGWTLSKITTEQNAVGPSGAANEAWTLTDADGANTGQVQKTVSKSSSDSTTYFQASVAIKKVSSASAYPRIGFAFGGGTAKYALYHINHVAGTVTASSLNNAANINYQVVSEGSFWRVWVFAQDNGSNNAVSFNFTPAANSNASGTVDAATTGSCVIANAMLTTGRIPSSYFAGAAAIGSELVTDGGLSAVTEGTELATGVLTVGNCYKITAHTDTDFTTVGAPDSNVGTYFNATATGGAGILDAGDKVKPITFTNWTAGAGWAPQATAGALTGKAQKIAGTGSGLIQTPVVTVGKTYIVTSDLTRTGGNFYYYIGSGTQSGAYASSQSIVYYPIAYGSQQISLFGDASFAGTIDNVSIKENGSVRTSEAKSISMTTPAALLAALADAGTVAIKIRFPFAKAAVSSATNILAFADSATSFLYMDSSGVFTLSDGTNTATNNDSFSADTDYILVARFKKADNDMDVGLGVPGSVSFDAAGTFDGAYTTTGNTTYIGHTIGHGVYIHWIKAWDEEKSAAFINALR